MPDFVETSDFLNRSTVLRRATVNRATFDPTNKQHLASLKAFIATGNWGDVQFYCEFPFSDVPMTVLMKFAGYHLGAHRETAEDRINRVGRQAQVDAVFEEAVLNSVEEAELAR